MDRRISTDEMINIGRQLINNADELHALLNKIANINDIVTSASTWAGPSATKYADIIAQQVPTMNLLANTIEGCGSYLVKAANYYAQTEQNLADSMGSNY